MERTLCIIKPDAVKKKVQGKILQMILDAGFEIKGIKYITLTKSQAQKFYEIHRGKPFYEDLVEYMTSGPCIPVALEKENAVNDYRALIGSTDPAEAAEGTVRKLFAESKSYNAVHGSDSVENGINEVNFFFAEYELI
jgi:nucleoside-diphosphate kinase